jgi:hypothetical protein
MDEARLAVFMVMKMEASWHSETLVFYDIMTQNTTTLTTEDVCMP